MAHFSHSFPHFSAWDGNFDQRCSAETLNRKGAASRRMSRRRSARATRRMGKAEVKANQSDMLQPDPKPLMAEIRPWHYQFYGVCRKCGRPWTYNNVMGFYCEACGVV